MGADLIALICHFILGLMVVTIIESPLFDACKDCACCESAVPRDDDIDLDDDVIEEEQRVSNMVLNQGDDLDSEEQNSKKIEVEDVEQ